MLYEVITYDIFILNDFFCRFLNPTKVRILSDDGKTVALNVRTDNHFLNHYGYNLETGLSNKP